MALLPENITARDLAVGAVRVAAMSQLGPLAGGLFLAYSGPVAKFLSDSKLAQPALEMVMKLTGPKVSALITSARLGFSGSHSRDLQKSMLPATQAALTSLEADAPPGHAEWFSSWSHYLTFHPPEEVFAGIPDLDPQCLLYTDAPFRDLWWTHMEPLLASWQAIDKAPVTSLNLNIAPLPAELAAFLRTRLPEALHHAHEQVLRDPALSKSWIAFQQRVYGETLDQLSAIRAQLDIIESKIDRLTPAPPTSLWLIPPPTHTFHDRPHLLTQIDHALTQGATALTALHGLGGIGKTQLALRFAQQRRPNYRVGVWLPAENELSLLTSLSAVAAELGLPPDQDQTALAHRTLHHLATLSPWLVIFDNATSPHTLRPITQHLTGKGDILITSRNQNWDGLATPVSTTLWPQEEATQFLLDRTQQTDRPAAQRLAKDLDGLILALEHAAAYMNAGDGLPLKHYREIWQKKLSHAPRGHDYKDSVHAAISLSLDAVADHAPAAYDLLCLFAWFDPDRIQKAELLEAGAAELPEALRDAFQDPDRWTELITELTTYSLITRERVDGVTNAYSLHRVVQQITRARMAEAGTTTQSLAAACNLTNEAFPCGSAELPFSAISDALLPHARAIRQHARNSICPASLGRLLNQAVLYLHVRGLYAEARDFLVLALESGLKQFGPDDPNVAVQRSNLANILRDLGEHAEARRQIELALESDLKQFGPDHPNVAAHRSNLASILHALGEHAEARRQIELALESDLKQFGPDHPDVALRRINLAAILCHQTDLPRALTQIDQALAILAKSMPPGHPHAVTAQYWRQRILEAMNPPSA